MLFIILSLLLVLLPFPSMSAFVHQGSSETRSLDVPKICDDLFHSIEKNKIHAVRSILKRITPNELCFKHPVCQFPLIYTIFKNSIFDRHDINTSLAVGCNAFHLACALGRAEIVALFVDHYSSQPSYILMEHFLKAPNSSNLTPFTLSILTAQISTLKFLTSKNLHDSKIDVAVICLRNYVACPIVKKYLISIYRLHLHHFPTLFRIPENYELKVLPETPVVSVVESEIIQSARKAVEESRKVREVVEISSATKQGVSNPLSVVDECGMSGNDYLQEEENVITVNYGKYAKKTPSKRDEDLVIISCSGSNSDNTLQASAESSTLTPLPLTPKLKANASFNRKSSFTNLEILYLSSEASTDVVVASNDKKNEKVGRHLCCLMILFDFIVRSLYAFLDILFSCCQFCPKDEEFLLHP